MNQGAEVNKGVFIAAIVAVVILVCIGGYYFLFAKHDGVPDSTRKAYMERMKGGPQTYGSPMGSGGPQSGGPQSGGFSGPYTSSGGTPTSGGQSGH